jgi:hypothetical protein
VIKFVSDLQQVGGFLRALKRHNPHLFQPIFYTNNHTVDFCDWIGKTLPKRILQEKKYGEFAEKETEHL